MSRRPIALSPDLLRLQNEGYDIEVRNGYLLVRDVPYVADQRLVERGILISKLNLVADKTQPPDDHVAQWTGKHPCHADGTKIRSIENGSGPQDFGNGIKADFTFSAKAQYRDYHHKITTYIGRITGEATQIDATATARTYPVIAEDSEEGIFKYVDTATSRAGIGAVNGKLAGKRFGIVGLGGTGAYTLDLVSKTEAAEIRIIDGDVFSQHNAFRAPGAPSLDELALKKKKVSHFADIYANMRHGITVHDVFLDETNLDLLNDLDFVFLCLDRGAIKRRVVEYLVGKSIPFIDVGMGILLNDDRLAGIVRLTVSTPTTREAAAPHISYAEGDGEANEYATNIQIAELNALNAALAVLHCKKYFGMYEDTRRHAYVGFALPSGEIAGEAA